jgi:hypothetical protein
MLAMYATIDEGGASPKWAAIVSAMDVAVRIAACVGFEGLMAVYLHAKMLHLFDPESKGAVRRNWSTSFQEATGTGSNAAGSFNRESC